jgi:hypothetical protein
MPSTRLVKAALVRLAGPNRAATRVIVFQYNPQSLRHGLQAGPLSSVPGAPAGQGQPWPGWLGGFGGLGGWFGGSGWGAPAAQSAAVSEMIRFTLVLDAADALESGDAVTTAAGLHPILAGLELLLREDAQPQGDAATVFVWGARRVMPVRLVALDVHERLFDPALNPLHARARVTLQALDGTEPGAGTLVPALFHQHQLMLQGLAQAADALTPQAAAEAAAGLAAGGAG